MKRVVATLSGGVLYGLPFVEPRLGACAFVGLAPALIVLSMPSLGRGRLLATCLLVALPAAVLIALPLGAISPVAILVQSTLKLPWPLGALMLFAVLRRRTDWPIGLLWPCCWVLFEWSWSIHTIGRTPFGLSGYTQFIYPRLIQFAEFTGVLGVSFLVQAVAGSLAEVGVAWCGAPAGARSAALRKRKVRIPLLACGCALALALAWGTVQLKIAKPAPGPRLALIQPAVPHRSDETHMRLVQYKQMGLARTLRPGEVDLVVFPENAVMTTLEDSPYLAQFQELSRTLQAPLLVGAMAHATVPPEFARPGDKYGTNSALIITGKGIVGRYDKIHLIAFSEQVPAERLFAALGLLDAYRSFIVGRLGYRGMGVPGDRMRLLRAPGIESAPMWTPICFEQIDTKLAREAAQAGARLFVNITSEGDLGSQIYWNTVAIAVLRAVELRVGVARCGNMGISGVIDPWGRQTRHLRGKSGALWGEPGVLTASVPLGSGQPTLYARLGDWPAGASALLLLAACLAAFFRRGTR